MAGTTALAFAEHGGGTTARKQRYNRSIQAGERQEPAVQPLQRAVQPLGSNSEQKKIRETLSLTPEKDKGGVRKVYVNRFPQFFLMRIPS